MVGKAEHIKTFKVDEDFNEWLRVERDHPALSDLGLSELIRISLKIAIPLLQSPPGFAETLSDFKKRCQS